MNKALVLFICILALALGASAQNQINFADLPLVKIPTPMPSNYQGLNWTNFFYVDPAEWSGSGPGYKLGATLNQDVAFVGGADCSCCLPSLLHSCNGIVSLNTSGGVRYPLSFQAVSATVAGGFGPTTMTLFAYNNGKYVGTSFYELSGGLQTIYFPSSWGNVTELNFQAAAGGDLVFYDLQVHFVR